MFEFRIWPKTLPPSFCFIADLFADVLKYFSQVDPKKNKFCNQLFTEFCKQ